MDSNKVLMMYQSMQEKLTNYILHQNMVMKLDHPPAYGMNFKKICVFFPPIAIADNHKNL